MVYSVAFTKVYIVVFTDCFTHCESQSSGASVEIFSANALAPEVRVPTCVDFVSQSETEKGKGEKDDNN